MSIRQATPGGGGRSRPDHFSYHWTEPSQPWTGWIAGPVHWIEAHSEPTPTKPCLRWITFNALGCPRCQPNVLPVTIGYLGVYREIDNAPILVVLHDNMWAESQYFKHGDYVRMSRPGGPTATVTVQRLLNKKEFKPGLPRRKVAVDLSMMLVKLWGINELTEWFMMNPDRGGSITTPACNTVTAPSEKPGKTVLDVEGIAGTLERNAQQARQRAERGEDIATKLRRRAAEQNGQHE